MVSVETTTEFGYVSGWLADGIVSLPSIGNVLAVSIFLLTIGLWKIPKAAAFDPQPQTATTSTNQHTKATMLAPTGPPPLARQLSSDSESERSSVEPLSSIPDEGAKESSLEETTECRKTPEPSIFLKTQAPDSTPAERQRFLAARDGNEEKALENLDIYLTWRKGYEHMVQEQEQKHSHLQAEDRDLYDWIVASQAALQANSDPGLVGWKWLPRVVRTPFLPHSQEGAKDRNGHRMLHMIPALIDDEICSLSTYTLAIALYLDRKLPRNEGEKITLLIDLRPGEGWRNIPGLSLVPFIKELVGMLLTMFPERLSKTILFPLHWSLQWVFAAVKAVIDPDTAEKIHVLSGSASVDAPLPVDQLSKHVARDVALITEKERLESFTA